MLKFCPECGNKINGGKFCGNCGADLTKYDTGNTVAENTNTGSSLDDALGNLMDFANEKQAEEAIARDFEIENGVLLKYKGVGSDVVIPDCVTSIGEKAFEKCESLTDITISESVMSIGSCAFYNCRSLSTVKFSKYSKLKKIEYGTFLDCTSLISIIIPDGVESIGDSAFSGCKSLGSIEIPDGVTNIGDWAFFGCSGLVSIKIGSNVQTIGRYAFCNCKDVKIVSIPSSLKEIGDNAFGECGVVDIGREGVYDVYYRGDVENWCEINGLGSLISPNTTLYINDKRITGEYQIPYGVKRINSGAFCGCNLLEKIIIPDSVNKIGNMAFSCCRKLYMASIPNTCGYESDSFPSYCKVIKR